MIKFIKLHSSEQSNTTLLFRVDLIQLGVECGDSTRISYEDEIYQVQEELDDIMEMINQ